MSQHQTEKPKGRPPLYQPTEAYILSDKVDAYFDSCDQGETVTRLDKSGKPQTFHRPIPYTVEDLALALGMTRETLNQYAKMDAFSDIVTRAKHRIQSSWVRGGLNGDLNVKMAALCLAANTKTYNVSRQVEQHNTITIEDRLRQARQRLPESVPEAEVVRIEHNEES